MMNLVEVKKGSRNGDLPISIHTVYKWHSMKRYPALIIKLAGKLFFDKDEWLRMAEETKEMQIKKAKAIRSRI